MTEHPADPPSPLTAEDVRGLNDAARTLIEQLDRHGLGNLALFEQQVAHLRGHLLTDELLASSPAPAGLDVRLQEAIDSPALQDAIYEDMVASWPHILGEVAPLEHVEQAKAGARRSALRSANAVRTYLLAVSKGQP